MAKVLGIVAEYNPFHNGHLYHIQRAKEQANADYVVTIMSGNFTQRGNTSIINKWDRAEMAIRGGSDLVIELPTLYSISSAENFADGAIKILDRLGFVNYISFGIEDENLTKLTKVSKVLYNEPNRYKKLLKFELDKGLSYPKSIENAIVGYFKNDSYRSIFEGSNNILGLEYLKALRRNKSKINPIGIKREKVYYNSTEIIDEYASAMGIRRLINNKDYRDISKVVPNYSYKILMDNINNGTVVNDIQRFSDIIFYKLRTMTLDEIRDLPEVSEGLENLLKNAAKETNNIVTLVNSVKSKRYIQSRIQRILVYAMLGITKKDIEMSEKTIPYIRVLGFSEKNGKKLLSDINWRATTITSVKRFEENNTNKKYKRMFEIDKRATDLYTLGYRDNSICGLDYTHKLIII